MDYPFPTLVANDALHFNGNTSKVVLSFDFFILKYLVTGSTLTCEYPLDMCNINQCVYITHMKTD